MRRSSELQGYRLKSLQAVKPELNRIVGTSPCQPDLAIELSEGRSEHRLHFLALPLDGRPEAHAARNTCADGRSRNLQS